MRRTVLDCGAMSAFRGGADIAARRDSTRSVANDPKRKSKGVTQRTSAQ